MPIDIGGGSLFWTSGIRTSGLRRDSKVIQGEFAKLGASGGKLGRLLSPKVLGIAGLVIGLEQVGEAAFKFSKEFESAFAQVKTISAQSVEGFEEMERAVLEMTTIIPVNAIEASEALYQIVSAGIDGADAMLLLEVASRAAIAGVTEVETAADGLTTIINAFSLEASDAEDVAAALFTTVKLGKTTFGELSSSVAQAASIAANSGISFQELLAAITTLTKSGVPTAQAVTQVRSAILAVTEVLGDGAFAGRTMQEAFIAVRDASNGSNTELRVMLGRVEALNAVLGLTGAKAQSAADDLNAIRTETENANEAFAVMVETTENQFKLLSNNIKQKFLKPVGDSLIEVAADIAKGINEIFETTEKRIAVLSKNIVTNFNKELENVGGVGDKRIAVQAEITKLQEQSEELSRKIADARTRLPSTIRESAEFFNKALDFIIPGGDVLPTPGLDARQEIKNLREQQEILKQAAISIAGISEDLRKPIPTDGLIESIKPLTEEKSVKTLKELKRAFDKAISEGDLDLAVQLRLQIADIEGTIKKAIEDVEKAALKIQRGVNQKIKPIPLKPFEISGTFVKAGTIVKKDLEAIVPSTNDMAENLVDAADSMQELSVFAGQFDSELAKSVQSIAGIVGGFGKILGAGGNPFEIFSGGLQILTGLFGGVDSEQEKIDARTEKIRTTIQAQNILLERQIQLLDELAGLDRTAGEADVLALIDRQVKEIHDLAISMGLLVNQTTAWGSSVNQIDVNGIEDLINQLQGFLTGINQDFNLFGGADFTVQNLTEVQGLIDEYNALIDRRRELLESLVQTSSEGIADIIRDGFADGKSTIEDFASTFEDLMKNAILESFKTQTLLVASKGFFDEFAELSRGGLTAQEIDTLRNSFGTIINTASEQFTALNDIFNQTFGADLFGGVTDQADSLAGQIGRSISEDTAIELVGLWTRTSFDVRQQVELQVQMVGIQTETAANTLRTAIACESLDSKISESTQDDRDTGLNLG